MATTTLATAGIASFCSAIAYAGLTMYNHRSKIARLRTQGVTLAPGWNWMFGHLLAFAKASQKYPADANVTTAMLGVFDEDSNDKHRVFLLDMWPMSDPVLVVPSPEVATQAAATFNFPKSPIVAKGMARMTGGPDLLTMDGPEWKFWRSVFNPAFSNTSMNDQIGVIVDRVEELCLILKDKAGHGVFCLDELTSKMTTDIIVKIILDLDIDYMRSDHPLIHAYNTILAWNSFWDPRILLNPLRPLIQGYYGRVMNRIIEKRLDELFLEMRHNDKGPSGSISNLSKSGGSVASLALKAYMEANEDTIGSNTMKLDPVFAKYATYQVRLFLLAGNDTTSTTIVYVYHLLSKHPETLARMRDEHDNVFGPDPGAAATSIRKDLSLLNKCRYTLAVIKETLRLFPPAGTTRHGPMGATIRNEDGVLIPVENVEVLMHHRAIHTNPRFWPRAEEFLPERWLAEPGDELYPSNTAAFRPFEHGPRNCIGQLLVMNEIRTVMALTARVFAIRPAYEESDAKKASEEGWATAFAKRMGFGNNIKTVRGDRAYQTDATAARPADGYPCYVELM